MKWRGLSREVTLARRFERGRAFWRRVEVGGRDECWPWHGEVGADGRGRYRGEPADAHAYRLVRGEAPPPGELVHRCGDPSCVNPEHLEAA